MVEVPRIIMLTGTGVAFTAAMVNPKPAANNDFLFQKVFGDGEFIAAGQLVIPPGSRKPTKSAKDNTYVSSNGCAHSANALATGVLSCRRRREFHAAQE